MTSSKDHEYMKAAVEIAKEGVLQNEGGPFGAIVVKEGLIIGRGNNKVIIDHDPTAHAEMVAIRQACQFLRSHQLTGCTIYTSCEPCPMCLGAIYWARPDRVIYACTREDAAAIDFDDAFIYHEIILPLSERQIPMSQYGRELGLDVLQLWQQKSDKTRY